MITPIKRCSHCKKEKPITEFYKDKTKKFECSSWCKKCGSERVRVRIYDNKAKIRCKRYRDSEKGQKHCKEYRKQWWKKNKIIYAGKMREYRQSSTGQLRVWNAQLKSDYGITIEEYAILLQKQNGVCGICKQPEITGNGRCQIMRLAVDHDHQTGKVRGLLCAKCNRKLGVLEDENFCECAELYLRRN